MDKRPPDRNTAVEGEEEQIASRAVHALPELDWECSTRQKIVLISLHEVRKSYVVNGEVTQVLKGIDLDIEAGSLTCSSSRAGSQDGLGRFS